MGRELRRVPLDFSWPLWKVCRRPPKGNGYQIWETVSEGSPISPPFSTPEDLARHMATTTWGADKGTSYEAWLAFIKGPGWAPSMVMTNSGLVSGVEDIGLRTETVQKQPKPTDTKANVDGSNAA